MSYCRWSGDCPWYVYHDVASGNVRDDQVVTICGEGSYTYRDLVDDFEGILKNLAYRPEWKRHPTDDEMDFLEKVLKAFMKNVEHEYPEKK